MGFGFRSFRGLALRLEEVWGLRFGVGKLRHDFEDLQDLNGMDACPGLLFRS